MAKKTNKLNNIRIKFSGDLAPHAPPPPPSHESNVIVAKFEASLQTERATRIVSLIVTSNEIVPRYRRTGSAHGGTSVDATFLGAHATAKHVLALLREPHNRLSLRRIVDAERGMSEYEPLSEAKMLAGAIYYHSTFAAR
ncbi:hypothetical protein [Rhizobium sp. X9]|uniref:hypothetical protein n=1 Tax=Rhizobium sp. X9 TaxID=2815360 RepID=UPI001C0D43D7|nr:hypothetical protein [Rhizobium sp. X9]